MTTMLSAKSIRTQLQRDLDLAVQAKDVEAAKDLLAQGADPNAFTSTYSGAPMHQMMYLAANGSCQMISAFLDANANIEGASERKLFNRPLLVACARAKFDQSKLLIDRGADIHSKDQGGWSPFMTAAAAGSIDICRYLIERGVDPLVTSNDKENALHVCWGKTAPNPILRWLLTEVPGLLDLIDARDKNLRTPLMNMAIFGTIEDLQAMIPHGPDPMVQDAKQLIASQLSTDKSKSDLLRAYEASYAAKAVMKVELRGCAHPDVRPLRDDATSARRTQSPCLSR